MLARSEAVHVVGHMALVRLARDKSIGELVLEWRDFLTCSGVTPSTRDRLLRL